MNTFLRHAVRPAVPRFKTYPASFLAGGGLNLDKRSKSSWKPSRGDWRRRGRFFALKLIPTHFWVLGYI